MHQMSLRTLVCALAAFVLFVLVVGSYVGNRAVERVNNAASQQRNALACELDEPTCDREAYERAQRPNR